MIMAQKLVRDDNYLSSMAKFRVEFRSEFKAKFRVETKVTSQELSKSRDQNLSSVDMLGN